MTLTIIQILDLLPKLMANPIHFDLVEKLLAHADKFNKTLKNDYSPKIIERILSLLPKLIEDKHFEFAEKLLKKAEDQNDRLKQKSDHN